MRVIAGRLRGSPLDAPEGRTTRPITDRVKEALFSILGHRLGTLGELPPVAVLDLFAGSGALGIESLSRGAASCLFVERDRTALRALRANLARLKLGEIARVGIENAWTMRIPAAAGGYGLIFVDPPYPDAVDSLRVVDLLERAAAALSPEGWLAFRHDARQPLALTGLRGLVCDDERQYRRMELMLFRRASGGEEAPAP